MGAWGHFVEAARKARSLPDGAALIEVAQRRAVALEARLSYLIIAVPDEARIAGLTITRNGDALEPAEWNRTMPVDGGTYRIEAKAPAHEPWSTSVTIENEKDKESVNVPRFAEIATPAVSTPAAIGAGGADDRPSAFTGRRKAALALGVVGVVGLGGGLGLELLSRSTYQDAKVPQAPWQLPRLRGLRRSSVVVRGRPAVLRRRSCAPYATRAGGGR